MYNTCTCILYISRVTYITFSLKLFVWCALFSGLNSISTSVLYSYVEQYTQFHSSPFLPLALTRSLSPSLILYVGIALHLRMLVHPLWKSLVKLVEQVFQQDQLGVLLTLPLTTSLVMQGNITTHECVNIVSHMNITEDIASPFSLYTSSYNDKYFGRASLQWCSPCGLWLMDHITNLYKDINIKRICSILHVALLAFEGGHYSWVTFILRVIFPLCLPLARHPF